MECIAGTPHEVWGETPLWECGCRECWRLEMDITDSDDKVTYAEWVKEHE